MKTRKQDHNNARIRQLNRLPNLLGIASFVCNLCANFEALYHVILSLRNIHREAVNEMNAKLDVVVLNCISYFCTREEILSIRFWSCR